MAKKKAARTDPVQDIIDRIAALSTADYDRLLTLIADAARGTHRVATVFTGGTSAPFYVSEIGGNDLPAHLVSFAHQLQLRFTARHQPGQQPSGINIIAAAAEHNAQTRAAPYKTGPQKKRETVQRRNAEISRAIEVGIVKPDELLTHLKNNFPDLVRKGKKDWIDAESMMRKYKSRKNDGESSPR